MDDAWTNRPSLSRLLFLLCRERASKRARTRAHARRGRCYWPAVVVVVVAASRESVERGNTPSRPVANKLKSTSPLECRQHCFPSSAVMGDGGFVGTTKYGVRKRANRQTGQGRGMYLYLVGAKHPYENTFAPPRSWSGNHVLADGDAPAGVTCLSLVWAEAVAGPHRQQGTGYGACDVPLVLWSHPVISSISPGTRVGVLSYAVIALCPPSSPPSVFHPPPSPSLPLGTFIWHRLSPSPLWPSLPFSLLPFLPPPIRVLESIEKALRKKGSRPIARTDRHIKRPLPPNRTGRSLASPPRGSTTGQRQQTVDWTARVSATSTPNFHPARTLQVGASTAPLPCIARRTALLLRRLFSLGSWLLTGELLLPTKYYSVVVASLACALVAARPRPFHPSSQGPPPSTTTVGLTIPIARYLEP